MEILLKQKRVRYSGSGQNSQGEPNSLEGRKGANSDQLSHDYDSSNGGEFATAIAAAAFVITFLGEEGSQNQEKMSEGLETSLTKIKSRKEEGSQNQKKMSDYLETSLTKIKSRKEDSTMRQPDPGTVSKRFPDKDAKDTQSPGEASRKKPEFSSVPTIKKTLTFSDQYLNGTPSTKPVREVDTRRQPPSQELGNTETMADEWEKAEMAKIQRWYERKNINLHSWEKHMKERVRSRVDMAESEQKRIKALSHYNRKTAAIDRLVEKEKTQYNEKRRNKESKAKERANKIRSTGKLPVTCCCCYCCS